jgi:acetyl esterase/lipase
MRAVGANSRLTRQTVAAIAVATIALAGCASARSANTTPSSASIPPSPPADLYQPPDPLPFAAAGTLIWAEKVLQPPLDPPGTIWRILYHSRSRTGADIAVSGFAIVPTAPVAAGSRRPIYAWAHGTQGQADSCAPSRQIRDNLPPYGGAEIGSGAAVVATDYEGLGTPGEPTALVGAAEAHAVLDSIRAATQLPGVGRAGPVILAGQSQGGGAALWAAQLAHGYAPDLDVRGVAALAPAAEFETIFNSIDSTATNKYLGNLLIAVDGLHAGYGPAFDPTALLTPAGLNELKAVSTMCVDQTITRWQNTSIKSIFAHNPDSVPAISQILESESPGATNPGVPIFLAQGADDQQIPLQVTAQLKASYCRLGAVVTRHVYPGADHDGVVDAATNDIGAWTTDLLAGRAVPDNC